MARIAAAAVMVMTILSLASVARGQPSSIVGLQDAGPVPDDEPDALVPTASPLAPCCCCGMDRIGATDRELTGVIAGGAAAAIVSYLFATLYATAQPHSLPTVEGIPIAGAIVAAARNPVDDRNAPLLLFSAGVQAIGVLVAAVAGADRAELRRLNIEVGACPGGFGVSWR